MTIDIDAVKKVRPGEETAEREAEKAESKDEAMRQRAIEMIEGAGYDYPDGRRKFGDELEILFTGGGDTGRMLKVLSEALRSKDLTDDAKKFLNDSTDVLSDGLKFYTDLALPQVWRTTSEIGFVYFVLKKLVGFMEKSLKDNHEAMMFSELCESLFKASMAVAAVYAEREGKNETE